MVRITLTNEAPGRRPGAGSNAVVIGVVDFVIVETNYVVGDHNVRATRWLDGLWRPSGSSLADPGYANVRVEAA